MTNILIIDDEAHIRRLYEDLLSREGYTVRSAENTEAAQKILDEGQVDLIILDIELRNENGLDLLHKLKSTNPSLPIILNSAYSIYMSDFKTWTAEAYILKSSDITPLLEKIRELTGEKGRHE